MREYDKGCQAKRKGLQIAVRVLFAGWNRPPTYGEVNVPSDGCFVCSVGSDDKRKDGGIHLQEQCREDSRSHFGNHKGVGKALFCSARSFDARAPMPGIIENAC